MVFITPILCRLTDHQWHPISWRTVWGEWGHLWRGYADAWGDHPTSWGIVGLFEPYSVSSHVCGRCGQLRRASCFGGVVHLNVVGSDAPEIQRPVACAGALMLSAAPSDDPFRRVG